MRGADAGWGDCWIAGMLGSWGSGIKGSVGAGVGLATCRLVGPFWMGKWNGGVSYSPGAVAQRVPTSEGVMYFVLLCI